MYLLLILDFNRESSNEYSRRLSEDSNERGNEDRKHKYRGGDQGEKKIYDFKVFLAMDFIKNEALSENFLMKVSAIIAM